MLCFVDYNAVLCKVGVADYPGGQPAAPSRTDGQRDLPPGTTLPYLLELLHF